MAEGFIQFKGDRGKNPGHTHKMTIFEPVGLTEVTALSVWLKANMSDCGVVKTGFTDEIRAWAAAPGLDVNVDEEAKLTFLNLTTGRPVTMTLYGYKSTIVDPQSEGDRVLTAVMDDIAVQLGTLTGDSFQAVEGVIVQVK